MPDAELEVPVELVIVLLELVSRSMPMLELEVPVELVIVLLELDPR